MNAAEPPYEANAGYAHPGYAESLAEFGTPRRLPACEGWVLTRSIPGFPDRDAMGCYPLFACRNWRRLAEDLTALREECVSLVLVTDPFGDYAPETLQTCFDRVTRFKEHFVTDLSVPIERIMPRSRRKEARQAFRRLTIEVVADPTAHLAEWNALYAQLIQRHDLRGISAFSPASFAQQFALPGAVLFGAFAQGAMVGAHGWFQQGEVAYSHLSAYSEAGYALGASTALYTAALERFAGRSRWLSLGAGAGVSADQSSPLADYKRDWATGTRPVYLCGRIFQPERYAALSAAKGAGETTFFPAYRRGEFAAPE